MICFLRPLPPGLPPFFTSFLCFSLLPIPSFFCYSLLSFPTSFLPSLPAFHHSRSDYPLAGRTRRPHRSPRSASRRFPLVGESDGRLRQRRRRRLRQDHPGQVPRRLSHGQSQGEIEGISTSGGQESRQMAQRSTRFLSLRPVSVWRCALLVSGP